MSTTGRAARRLAAMVMATALALAAGCGGHTVTKKDVIARADAICAGTLRSVRATPAPSAGQTSLSSLSGYLQRVLPIVDREVTQIRALPRPAQDQGLLDSYVAAVTSSGSDYHALAAAARQGDQAGAARALAALRSNPAASLAGRYGLVDCAAPASTSVS